MKNIQVRFGALALLILLTSLLGGVSSQAQDTGFVSIFDGKTLKGWDGDPKFWKVQDGAFRGHTSSVEDIQWSPSQDTVFATCSADHSVRIQLIRLSDLSGFSF